MSVSLEALAMAGENYLDYGMDSLMWERNDEYETPPHLLAENYEDICSKCFSAYRSKQTECSRNHKRKSSLKSMGMSMVESIKRLLMVVKLVISMK